MWKFIAGLLIAILCFEVFIRAWYIIVPFWLIALLGYVIAGFFFKAEGLGWLGLGVLAILVVVAAEIGIMYLLWTSSLSGDWKIGAFATMIGVPAVLVALVEP